MCQFRLLTVICAVGVMEPPSVVFTVTLTVPPVTICPDQELLVLLLVTVLPLESVNFQLPKVAPLGPLAVQVVVPPRVTDEGEQLTVITLSLPLAFRRCIGQRSGVCTTCKSELCV